MTVLDRMNLEKRIRESELSINTENIIGMGQVTQTKYFLNGAIQKTALGGYILQLRIADTVTGSAKATFNGSFTLAELEDSSAARKAANNLLGQMGVILTALGEQALLRPLSANQSQAQALLARGTTADSSIQALDYYYQARALDPSLREASARASAASATISSGSLGDSSRNEIALYNEWLKIVREADKYFSENPPYELIFDPSTLKQAGNINFQRGTADFSFEFMVIPTTGVQVILDIVDGLKKSNMRRELLQWWPYGLGWPYRGQVANIGFIDGGRIYINAELLNEKGSVIGKTSIEEVISNFVSYDHRDDTGYGAIGGISFLVGDYNRRHHRKEIVIRDVKAGDIEGELSIRLSATIRMNWWHPNHNSNSIRYSFPVSAINFSEIIEQAKPFEVVGFRYGGIYLEKVASGTRRGTFTSPNRINRWQVVSIDGQRR